MATAQKIIDLDAIVPDDLAVRIDGEDYPLPGDIPIPDYLAITQALDAVENAEGADAVEQLKNLYERILDIFRIRDPELEELPIGPHRLGPLIVQLYGNTAEADAPPRPTRRPRPSGTRNTRQRAKPRKSRSQK